MTKPTLRFGLIRHAELQEKQIFIITVSCEFYILQSIRRKQRV